MQIMNVSNYQSLQNFKGNPVSLGADVLINMKKNAELLGVSVEEYLKMAAKNPRLEKLRAEVLAETLSAAEMNGVKNILKSNPELLTLRPSVISETVEEALSVVGMTKAEYLNKIKNLLNPKLNINEADRTFVTNWFKDKNGYFTFIQSRNGVPESIKILPNGSKIV